MAATAVAVSGGEWAATSWILVVLRDISRGGFAGILVGLLGCGIGGRLVMRLAALLAPGAEGMVTENGNFIGDITLEGTSALVLFGLIVGLIGGTIWVIVSPWIPGVGLRRAVLTIPIAIVIGGRGLIDGSNPDFRILEHSAAVVASLIGLIAIIGVMFALVDDWLDRRLPHPVSRRSPVPWLYAGVAVMGTVLVLPIVVLGFLLSSEPSVVVIGIAIVTTGLATLAWWVRRWEGQVAPTSRTILVGRAGLLVMVVVGIVALAPELATALGLERA